jgi:hypothetical protein
MFALLSIFIISYVYLSWKIRADRAAVPKPSAETPNMLPHMGSKPIAAHNPTAPQHAFAGHHLWWKKQTSSLGDWLAPILVWAAVVWTTLAVAAILLGET